MPEYGFGPGSLYAVPAGGGTPLRFGGIQDFSLDISATVKELFGQSQFPLLVQRGTMKVTGKAKAAQISAAAFNTVFFGQSVVIGGTTVSVDESGTVPATTTYTISVANHTTFVEDLGVTYAATGLPLTKVATISAIGQYSVAAGIYTFYSGDASAAVKLNYTYTVAGGSSLAVTNQLIGTTPTFQMVFTQTTNGKTQTITFNQATSSKLSMATKLEDFTIPEFDVSFFADASGTLFTMTTSE